MSNLTKTEFSWLCEYAKRNGVPVDDLADHYVHVINCKNCHFSWVALLSPKLTIGQLHKIYCPQCLHNEDGPYEPPILCYTPY